MAAQRISTGKTACHCLQITEEDLERAYATHEIRSIEDIERTTSAGEGCMSCHPALMAFLSKRRAEDSGANWILKRAARSSSSPFLPA